MTPTYEQMQETSRRAHEIYEQQLRPKVETPENIGKMLVIDVNSGDYEIDDQGIETAHRLRTKHPNAELYGIRIGYKTAVAFGTTLERITP